MTETTLTEQEIARIREALKEVYDPEIGISVVDLGLVRKIEEVDGEIQITMILTAPFCPLAGLILEQARGGPGRHREAREGRAGDGALASLYDGGRGPPAPGLRI